ncbi:phosphoenolpyruvate carboxylase [Aurantivibrio infirmus]
MQIDNHQELKACVDMLGRILGDTMLHAGSKSVVDEIEHIRLLAKASRESEPSKRDELFSYLEGLSPERLLIIARAFNQFLNLANISEQFYSTRSIDNQQLNILSSVSTQINNLVQNGIDKNSIADELTNLRIDLVLTAHPTEVTRRTLIEKQYRIYRSLQQLELCKNDPERISRIQNRLAQLIAQWWDTDEIRTEKPSPVDEAVWGFAVIENSLWEAVPRFVNQLESTAKELLGLDLPIEYSPVKFTSWMGGDRDGNPFVTANVTREVILLARWKAADLFLEDINHLISELSMTTCSPALRKLAGEGREPYRIVLKDIRSLLLNTLQYTDDLLKGRTPDESPILTSAEQLWEPLYICFSSLNDSGMEIIANGDLKNVLRRIKCFGVYLLGLDIRQESSRHKQVFEELTQYLDIGDYGQWTEEEKINFLLTELDSKRPLFPHRWQPSEAVSEVLSTFSMIAEQPEDALGAYVISMAKAPSDVLAVRLLLNEAGCRFEMPIAPLFETLDDLNNCAEVMNKLFSLEPYKRAINNRQMVMIGYSDSAKDAGVMAAGWAQYEAQEQLLSVCEKEGIELTLFHGRGGTIGRGGAPAHAALLSQPPGSLKNGLRVTEQGEMIRFKLGVPEAAVTSLGLYTSAMLESNLLPPPTPNQDWRTLMSKITKTSAQAYRALVFQNEEFLPYFRQATPINELSKLPLGSRPAKRKNDGGVESLRAIPWIFAWSQNRLMIPAWFGAGLALEQAIKEGQKQQLETMCQQWPFFSTRISMLEMVYAKADSQLALYYENHLVEKRLKPLGEELQTQLKKDIDVVLSIANEQSLLQGLPWLKESVILRNTYTDPLNLLQVELLKRIRKSDDSDVEKALMVTIAGIAAGVRNTG